jgi:EPS-associated MarR family transcriptional regulator
MTPQEATHFRVLRILQENPDITQRELAQRLGMSVSGLNYCLKALIAKGWVKVQNFKNSGNKLGYAYLLTPTGFTQKVAMTSLFIKCKMQEFEALRAELNSLRKEHESEI